MLNIKDLIEIISKAALAADILIIGGWAYACILLVVLLYRLFLYAAKKF